MKWTERKRKQMIQSRTPKYTIQYKIQYIIPDTFTNKESVAQLDSLHNQLKSYLRPLNWCDLNLQQVTVGHCRFCPEIQTSCRSKRSKGLAHCAVALPQLKHRDPRALEENGRIWNFAPKLRYDTVWGDLLISFVSLFSLFLLLLLLFGSALRSLFLLWSAGWVFIPHFLALGCQASSAPPWQDASTSNN